MHQSPSRLPFVCLEASLTTWFAKRTSQTVNCLEGSEGVYIQDLVNTVLPYT